MTTKAIVRKVVDVIPVQANGRKQKRPRAVWDLTRDKWLDGEQVERLLAAARQLPDERVGFLVYLAVNCGARISELLQLRANSIHPHESLLTLPTLKQKTARTREVPVSDATAATVRRWISAHQFDGDDYLFPSPYGEGAHVTRQWAYQMFTRAALAAGVKTWGQDKAHRGNGIHALRHAHACLCLQASKNNGLGPLETLLNIAKRLGHSDMKSTLVYVHAQDGRQLADAVGEIGKAVPAVREARLARVPARLPAPRPAQKALALPAPSRFPPEIAEELRVVRGKRQPLQPAGA